MPIRKEGKLPHTTNRLSYDLEYGTDVIEIHRDAITPGKNRSGGRYNSHRRDGKCRS